MHILVGPIHFGNVYQTLNPLLDLDECTIISQIGHLAEHARALRVAACKTIPRIIAHLLDAERDAILLLVEFQYLGFDLIAHGQYFGRMLDSAPCQIGDMQQTVDTAQVHECTVVGDVLDHSLDDRAFLEILYDRFAVGARTRFQHRASGNHHIVALAVKLDDFQLHGLVFVRRRVLHRSYIHQ